ncbi:hypothetical protein [Tropicimonas marinistellae]|uniref:hypothetical protein n=1 Tax=Tropicimonas marinistellae TaxID=1739787 RepID=UPI00191B8B18|nr:hypothetical protein [Tropicimonas marinistellae]
MTRLLALLAFLALAGFVLILIIEVPSPDLIAVSVLTIGLVAYDFLTSSGKPKE